MLEAGADNLPFDATPDLMVQYSSMHAAKVMDVKDPEGRGRVRLLCPGLLGVGKENWTDWVEVSGSPIGGVGGTKGDQGMFWPLQPGQLVLMGFVSGDPFAYFCIPGPPCQKEEKAGSQLTPLESKKAFKSSPREATRIRGLKTESGATLLFDDRGKKEKVALVDSVGAGLFLCGPGKEADEEEKEGEESKERKGERRGTKLIVNGDTKKPAEICRDGKHMLGLFDLIGSGIIQYCSDEQGIVAVFARDPQGEIKVSFVADAKNETAYITAGPMQIQVLGKHNKIAVTRQIIQEVEKVDVESVIDTLASAFGKEFEEFKEPSEGSGGDQGGGGGTTV